MNSSQMAVEEEEQERRPTHSYNLRERPTKLKQQVSLAVAQGDDITGVTEEGQYTTIHLKVHSHVMLTQMNIRYGWLAFGEKGNEAILKELRQLHQKKHYCQLWKKTWHMTKEKRH